jgi:hypothetical protein
MNAKMWGNNERLVTLFPAQDLHSTVQLIVVGLSVPARFGRPDRPDCEWLLRFLTNGNNLSLGARSRVQLDVGQESVE